MLTHAPIVSPLTELTQLDRLWRKVSPARRVTLPSQMGDRDRRVTLLAEPPFGFSCERLEDRSNKATLQLTIPRSLFKSSAKDLSPATLEFGIGSALGVSFCLPWHLGTHEDRSLLFLFA